MPPHQQSVLTTPARRGPTCSSHPPHSAADEPKNTKNSVYIQPNVEIFQSQVVINSSLKKLTSAGQARLCLIPMAFDSGSQKTEKP